MGQIEVRGPPGLRLYSGDERLQQTLITLRAADAQPRHCSVIKLPG